MTDFIPGVELSGRFYVEAVKPVFDRQFPRLRYSAALIGWGSKVLGFDTPISCDHHWGPRLLIFLSERDHSRFEREISSVLSLKLPYEFLGYSTNFTKAQPNGVRLAERITTGKVDHMVQVFTIRSFFHARLRFDPYKKISVTDWLIFPQQRLLELTSGAVYHDGLGQLEKIRRKFTFYPDDVWLYMLAAQWKKISQEEAFVGRAGDVGDELGSRLIAARLVREIMRLCFLMERRYAPYSKWLGTAFKDLKISEKLLPIFREVLAATNWKERERALSRGYSIVAKVHNGLGITEPLPTKATSYFSRPFNVIHADKFAEEIRKVIKGPAVRKIRVDIGSIDQFTDSTDVVGDLDLCRELRAIYQPSG